MSEFNTISKDVNVIFTEYTFNSGIWALNASKDFVYEVSNADLPKDSKFSLDTDDYFLLLAVPGLFDYPHVNITINISLGKSGSVTITPNGSLFKGNILFDFALVDDQAPLNLGWTIDFAVSSTLHMDTYLLPNGSIASNLTFTDWKNSASLVKSNVGTVHTSLFEIVFIAVTQLENRPIEEAISPDLHGFVIKYINTKMLDHYIRIENNVLYTPPSFIPCGSHKCALQNTCCNWSTGKGCCTFPNAVCCSEGCCPHGKRCDSGHCSGFLLN
eukprot:TRINITY_DN7826_c0_g1_i3.p2 TRINITY_DN7826_c0_g1~~TRINITY_DN7826_c0_g1_i3.p2  ORF type:complete len:272 (+),score=45.12 TRINITY_DN7826_c0_g1_i3:892-1707(+)